MASLFVVFIAEWILFLIFIYLVTYWYGGKLEFNWTKENLKNQYWFFFMVFACIIIMVIRSFDPEPFSSRLFLDNSVLDYIGLFINTIGLVFAAWVRMVLNKNWSNMIMIKSDQKLIKTGPYRLVRNPMYTGIIVALAGCIISSNQLYFFIVILIAAIGIWMKIKTEEKLLLKEFGEEYSKYMNETKALIPYIL